MAARVALCSAESKSRRFACQRCFLQHIRRYFVGSKRSFHMMFNINPCIRVISNSPGAPVLLPEQPLQPQPETIRHLRERNTLSSACGNPLALH